MTSEELEFLRQVIAKLNRVERRLAVLETGESSGSAVDSVNTQTGDVVLNADHIDDAATTHKFATAAQLAAADSAVQPGDLATVATSGAYSDLSGAPSIPATFDDLSDGTTNKAFTATEKAKLSGIEALSDVTDLANVGSSIHGASAKTPPVDADTMPLIDSAASNVLKKVTWANIKATLKTYFDTLYGIKDGFRGAKVINGSNISIANNTFTALTFDSEEYDTDSFHHASVNIGRLTAPVAGKYLIIAQVAFAQNATGIRGVQIRLNGTTTIASNFVQPFLGASADLMAVTEYNLATSDYVEVLVYQNSGGALNVVYATQYTPAFSMSLRNTP